MAVKNFWIMETEKLIKALIYLHERYNKETIASIQFADNTGEKFTYKFKDGYERTIDFKGTFVLK